MKNLNKVLHTYLYTCVMLALSLLSGCRESVPLISSDDCVCYTEDGETKCLGLQNKFGTCGPSSSARSTQKILGLPGSAKNLDAGNDTNCAIVDNGAVQSWGKNMINSNALDTARPFYIQGLHGPALELAVGDEHACAMVKVGGNNRVQCWGSNDQGQLGTRNVPHNANDDRVISGTAVYVQNWDGSEAMDHVLSIAAGDDHTCALKDTGKIMCWGYHGGAILGFGAAQGEQYWPTTPQTPENRKCVDDEYCVLPSAVQGIPTTLGVKKIVAGGSHTCAITSNDRLYCWGDNSFYKVGYPGGDVLSARKITTTSGDFIVHKGLVALGADHTCAVRENDGKLYCWGDGSAGQLGWNSAGGYQYVPTDAGISIAYSEIESVAAGRAHTCVVMKEHGFFSFNDGRMLECFGSININTLISGSWPSSVFPSIDYKPEGAYIETIDRYDGKRFAYGYAFDKNEPLAPLTLEVVFYDFDGHQWPPIRVVANKPSPELSLGKGIPGDHGFMVARPAGMRGGILVSRVTSSGAKVAVIWQWMDQHCGGLEEPICTTGSVCEPGLRNYLGTCLPLF